MITKKKRSLKIWIC